MAVAVEEAGVAGSDLVAGVTGGSVAGFVDLSGDVLRVHRLATRDREVVAAAQRELRAGGDLARWAVSTLELGARASGLANGAVAADALGQRLEGLVRTAVASADASAERVRSAVDGATDAESGAIAVAVGRQLDRLTADVGRLVEGEDAPVRMAVERAVRTAAESTAAELQRALAGHAVLVRSALSVDDPAGPLHVLRREVLRTAEETRRELGDQLGAVRALVEGARERKATMQLTAVKGADYEEAVVEAVDRIAYGMGDACEAVGTTAGLRHGAKTGDAVSTVSERTTRGRRVRIVVEAKHQAWGPDRWKRELESARGNRDAVAALGVVADPTLMPGGRLVHILSPLDVLVCLRPGTDDEQVLAAAYALLRVQAVTTVLADEGGDGVDLAAVRAAVAGTVEALAGFDAIDRAASGARKSLEQVARGASELRAELVDRLARAARLLEQAPGSTTS